ncbi:MAG: PqqD family peptide modification chaperone [Chitinivibrionales bacterium]|nr:PqqD family peptide modification chaperone [Chitinivibrionales bacterium]MBD3396324.1 PqqD family peptide modification chaperone [Chitinivibrionales bacterium]
MQYTKARNLSVKRVKDETFVLNRDESSIHSFNSTGAFLWDRIQNQEGVPEIEKALCNEYNLDKETASRDVAEFLQSLAAAKLISLGE